MMNRWLKYIGGLAIIAVLFSMRINVEQAEIIVAQDGSGQFASIQEAINSLPDEALGQRVILVKKGVYREKLFVEKNFVTLRGESPEQTTVVTSEARDKFRCTNADDWGAATINLKGSDLCLENMSFINDYGTTATGDTMIACPADSIVKEKKVKTTGHQMALRSYNTTRLIVKNCIFRSGGGDTVSPWNAAEGMFFFKDCVFEGGVDMYCPRGWALADHCLFICHSREAAIWHDGSKNHQSKTVFFNCTFTGDDGFKLGRYHRDAQFYLLDCSFAQNMADADIYQKAAVPPNTIQWGRRVFYYNCHKEGGDYAWHRNNLPGDIGINDINTAWVYDYKWKPNAVPVKAGSDDSYEKPLATGKIFYDTVAENMLLFQRANGGWPKHFNKEKINYRHLFSETEKKEIQAGYESGIDATIDNNATTREIRYLAKWYKKTGDKRYLTAAEKGVGYLLQAQYANGGWPQYYPDFSSYRSEITYNDNAMINVLNVLADVLEGRNDMEVITQSFQRRCAQAIQQGIKCILRTQLKQRKKLTVWCAQYDAKTLQPATARAYELPSLSGQESVAILRFLMRQDKPGKAIKKAIINGIQWFEQVKIEGYQFKEIVSAHTPNGKDRVLVPVAGNITWARFYDLNTNEPFFVGRDGIRKKDLQEIEHERRIGYAWYTEQPAELLKEYYTQWTKKWMK
ncbi:MAG TPA: pectate lyase [Ferruginibacter sp.]|nr:pectate lyase [Ferruginibacter sp.]HMP20550.1 pectate lyase [Ferruginibacter sp.]